MPRIYPRPSPTVDLTTEQISAAMEQALHLRRRTAMDPDSVRAVVLEVDRRAIVDRRGYIVGPDLVEQGYCVELLSPARQVFEGRDETMALAWCLIYLMGETDELGMSAFWV